MPDDEGNTTAEGLPGCATGADACDLGWVVNDIRAVANNEFIDENPDAAVLLEAVEIPLADIDAQKTAMYEACDGYTEDDIARDAADWIEENRSTVDGWPERARSSS
jgi:glycine betaine/proline transport system substrate-binding protein